MGRLTGREDYNWIGIVDSSKIPNPAPPAIVFQSGQSKKQNETDILGMIKSIAGIAKGLGANPTPTTGEDFSNNFNPLGFFGITKDSGTDGAVVPYSNATQIMGEVPPAGSQNIAMPYSQLAPYNNALSYGTAPATIGDVYNKPKLQSILEMLGNS